MATLRIVGGHLGGRRFAGPKAAGVRPTSERVREAVASALASRGAIEGGRVLDLFAGTGALAFEALSRGAARATLVDRDRRVLRALTVAAGQLGIAAQVRTLSTDLLADPARVASLLAEDGPFSLTFVDPPYAEGKAVEPLIETLMDRGALEPGGWIVLEHDANLPPPHMGLASVARYRYGGTGVLLGIVPPRRTEE